MDLSLGMLIVSFLMAGVLLKLLKPVACWVGMVDKPGGRKRHEGLIPLIGGISVFGAVFLTAYLFLAQPTFIRLFMVGCAFMVFLGAIDDRYDISARFRLVGQLLIASIFVYGLDIYLANFGNLLGLGDIHAGWLGYPLAILSLVGVVNAFNMLDGIDGLIGSLGVVSFLGLFYLFGSAGHMDLALLCITFVGALLAFLVFNIWGNTQEKSTLGKVFMGDAGSMLVGLAVGVLVIAGAQGEAAAFKPITALWFVLLPMTDMFTIMYRRVKRGKSPVAPDRTHIHHILVRAGFRPKQTLCILMAVQGLMVGFGVAAMNVPHGEALSFAGALVFVGLYQLLMRRSWRFIRWNKKRFAAATVSAY